MECWRTVFVFFFSLLMAVAAAAQQATNQSPSQHAVRTRVVLLGTGTPVPDPDRSGPATAIVVDDRAYLIDFGPGVVRRAESAALNRKIPAVEPGNLKVAFVTHLHSDHTAETPTKYNRESSIRTKRSPSRHLRRNMRWRVYGYRFDTRDRSIVISGDTNPVEATINACSGCDVLIHEAQPLELLTKMPESIQSFVAKYHTTTEQLAELAKKAKPKLLVIYHTVSFPPGIAPPRLLPPKGGADALYASPEKLQKEMGSRYSGKFVIGKDLDVY
jgi:ribonuclease BN (tRNA processing enzyme)